MVEAPFSCLYSVLAVIGFIISGSYTLITGDMLFSGVDFFKHWLDKQIFEMFGAYVFGGLQLFAAGFFLWFLIVDCKSSKENELEVP